jgi:hypothetical protein
MGKKAAGEIDGRTDIYSLGVVLYQMVTAQLPFEGDTPYSLMLQHIQGTVRPPHELVPELHIPEALSRVILKAIDKSRDLRFQTAEELIAALDQVADDRVTDDRVTTGQVVSEPVTNVPAPASTGASQSGASQVRASQVSPPTPRNSQPSLAANVRTPAPSATQPLTSPVAAQPPLAGTSSGGAAPTADSVLVKSAAQHVFVQPRKFRLKHLLVLVALLLAGALVAGVGYVKYQEYQRIRIEKAINARFKAVPSLNQAELRVFVSDKREVTLDGKVGSKDDFIAAGDLAASVRGVTSVVNRVAYTPVVQTTGPTGVPAQSPESLISDGTKYLDDGKYAEAISCFSKAAEADPNNNGAKEWLDRARRAQKTEEELLKNRR